MHRALVIIALYALAACGSEADARAPAAALGTNRAPVRAHDFRTSKRLLNDDVYTDQSAREDVYCGCPYTRERVIDPVACGYTPREHERDRAYRMEWEHVVPFATFARAFPCYAGERPRGQSRREHCVATEPALRDMEGDMHNLFPSLGQVNSIREDFELAELEGEAHVGGCDFEVDPRSRRAEPRPASRGELARAYLYMHVTYRLPLTDEARARFVRWHLEDPPTIFERERNRRIAALQGNDNPFVVHPDLGR
jgi:deoxyribonuclease-1